MHPRLLKFAKRALLIIVPLAFVWLVLFSSKYRLSAASAIYANPAVERGAEALLTLELSDRQIWFLETPSEYISAWTDRRLGLWRSRGHLRYPKHVAMDGYTLDRTLDPVQIVGMATVPSGKLGQPFTHILLIRSSDPAVAQVFVSSSGEAFESTGDLLAVRYEAMGFLDDGRIYATDASGQPLYVLTDMMGGAAAPQIISFVPMK